MKKFTLTLLMAALIVNRGAFAAPPPSSFTNTSFQIRFTNISYVGNEPIGTGLVVWGKVATSSGVMINNVTYNPPANTLVKLYVSGALLNGDGCVAMAAKELTTSDLLRVLKPTYVQNGMFNVQHSTVSGTAIINANDWAFSLGQSSTSIKAICQIGPE